MFDIHFSYLSVINIFQVNDLDLQSCFWLCFNFRKYFCLSHVYSIKVHNALNLFLFILK